MGGTHSSSFRRLPGAQEREAAVTAVRHGAHNNVFDVLLELLQGKISLADVHPDDRPFLNGYSTQ